MRVWVLTKHFSVSQEHCPERDCKYTEVEVWKTANQAKKRADEIEGTLSLPSATKLDFITWECMMVQGVHKEVHLY